MGGEFRTHSIKDCPSSYSCINKKTLNEDHHGYQEMWPNKKESEGNVQKSED